jgi:serine O-acetyltransferase
MNLINFHHLAHRLYLKKIPILPKIIYYLQFLIFNSSVPYKCKIGEGSKLAYGGMGVVIHERAIIGKNCLIGQGITIGGKSKEYEVPQIGDNVYIAAGARIIGNVKIGSNVLIGANAVVVKDVPSNCIVAGIPAKVIRENINLSDYEDI